MAYVILGNDLRAVRAAARVCNLEFIDDVKEFRHRVLTALDFPDFMRPGLGSGTTPPCRAVLRPVLVKVRISKTTNLAPVHEAGLYQDSSGNYWAVWDNFKEGFGLTGLLREDGGRLRLAYVIEAVDHFATDHGLRRTSGLAAVDGYTTLELTDMSRKLIVRIPPNGQDVKIEVEGCTGPECQTLTAALESRLGKVSADVPTEDMYRQQEQHQSAAEGG